MVAYMYREPEASTRDFCEVWVGIRWHSQSNSLRAKKWSHKNQLMHQHSAHSKQNRYLVMVKIGSDADSKGQAGRKSKFWAVAFIVMECWFLRMQLLFISLMLEGCQRKWSSGLCPLGALGPAANGSVTDGYCVWSASQLWGISCSEWNDLVSCLTGCKNLHKNYPLGQFMTRITDSDQVWVMFRGLRS